MRQQHEAVQGHQVCTYNNYAVTNAMATRLSVSIM
jgi:hypothetical protein